MYNYIGLVFSIMHCVHVYDKNIRNILHEKKSSATLLGFLSRFLGFFSLQFTVERPWYAAMLLSSIIVEENISCPH